MPDLTLVLRRANVSRQGGEWKDEDYDVFDGERCVGRIFLDASDTWFWGVDFQPTGRKSCGHVTTLEEAKAAFRAEYVARQVARFSAACHEVGHALVAHRLEVPVGDLRVGINGDDWAGKADIGLCHYLPPIDQLAVCFGGIEAQSLVKCEMMERVGFSDYARAQTILDENDIGEPEGQMLREAAHQRARDLLIPQLDKLKEVAAELAIAGRIAADRMRSLLQ
jgi:hypothetical protein